MLLLCCCDLLIYVPSCTHRSIRFFLSFLIPGLGMFSEVLQFYSWKDLLNV